MPLHFSEHVECPELAPLTFFLVQAAKPQRALEVGTVTGDSYLTLCQAVQSCGLATECTSIPRRNHSPASLAESTSVDDFRAYHDSTYGTFSRIRDELADAVLNPYLKFDFIHLVSPRSPTELELLCRESFSQLNPSGVAVISGLEQLDASDLDRLASVWRGQYSTRILELPAKVVVLSKHPVGLIRLLLQASDQEFADAVQLFRVLGDRVRSNAAMQRTADSLQVSRGRYASLAQERALLQKQYDSLEAREIEAQVQRGNKELHLNLVWAEKEDFRKRLTGERDQQAAAQSEHPATVSPGPQDVGARRIIVDLYQNYCDASPTTHSTGKPFWDSCGRDILDSVLHNQRPLRFTASSRPKISIVVVLRNKAHLSTLGLLALLRNFRSNYELVIVDNASSDDTPRLLSLIECTRIVRNDENLGFGPAVMQALPWLSGELVCLLNNDALVEPGTIETMINLFSQQSSAGAAGGKILLADGRLQEAGCIVWRDGRTRQYGRGEDPELPQYNFRRPVDYCSGAFLVTPRSLFEELGGLEESYGAGYYEDVDYCAKVWQAGRMVVYDPQAVLHHYEGASSSNEIAALQLLVRNHEHFASRWKSALRLHQIETPENLLRARVASAPAVLRLIYIVDARGVPALESELAKRRQESDRCSFTCIYTGSEMLRSSSNQCPIGNDVEWLSLDTMSRTDLEAYFQASDEIVVAAHQSSIAQLDSLLESNAAKLTRISAKSPTWP